MQEPTSHDDHKHDHDQHGHEHDDHEHVEHEHDGEEGSGHEHGRVNANLYGNRIGLRAVQISTAGMFIVAVIQFAIAGIGGSAGLFADALHNLGDVFTTVALWIAFVLSTRAANQRYTYGYHRIDGLTSLAAFVGLIGVALGLRIADPLAGLVITAVILTVIYSTSRSVLQRLLDAVDPRIVPSIITTASEVPGVEDVTDVLARCVGRTLHVILNIEVDAELTLVQTHAIAEEVRHCLFHSITDLSEATIHTDPHSHGEAATDYHQTAAHHLQEAQRPIVQR